MFAATSPTCCLSMPSTTNLVGVSTRNAMPSGGLTTTGWLNPSANSRSLPLAWTRYPTPTISSVLAKPWVTPVTMFAISERESPCSALISPSSDGLVTVITPPSWTTSIGTATSWLSVPFGPFTVTSRPLIVTSTPAGTTTGVRPIRDIVSSLPHVGEDFPAHALLLGLPVGQQAARRRDDRDAEAAEHPRQVVLARVDPQAWLRDALDPGDRALPRRAVLQRDHQGLANLRVLDPPAGDVALLLEYLGDVHLDLRVRHRDRIVVGGIGVAQTSQHVRDRVGHSHGLMAPPRRGFP